MQFGRLMFTAYEGFVMATSQIADDLKRWVGVTSLGAGQYQDFAAKPLANPESSEQPSSNPPKTAKNQRTSRNSLPRFDFHGMKALRGGLNKGVDLVPFLVPQKVQARLDSPVGLGFQKFGHHPVLK